MMRGMKIKGISETKSVSRERGAIQQNIANNLNKCRQFKVLKIILLPSWKSTSQNQGKKFKAIVLGGKELSENEQFLEDLIEGFNESERGTEPGTQKKTVWYWKRKRKAQEMREKAMKRLGGTRKQKGQDEKDAGDENQRRRCSSEVIGFLREKREHDGEFRSEDLQ